MRPVSASSVYAIRDLVLAYADLVGESDIEGVAHLFAYGELSATGNPRVSRGRDEVRETYLATLGPPGSERPHIHNVTTNLIVDVDDDRGMATCRSYFTVVRAPSRDAPRVSIAGRYEDTFHRIEGTWRFARRHIIIDLMGNAGDLLAGVAALSEGGGGG